MLTFGHKCGFSLAVFHKCFRMFLFFFETQRTVARPCPIGPTIREGGDRGWCEDGEEKHGEETEDDEEKHGEETEDEETEDE